MKLQTTSLVKDRRAQDRQKRQLKWLLEGLFKSHGNWRRNEDENEELEVIHEKNDKYQTALDYLTYRLSDTSQFYGKQVAKHVLK